MLMVETGRKSLSKSQENVTWGISQICWGSVAKLIYTSEMSLFMLKHYCRGKICSGHSIHLKADGF